MKLFTIHPGASSSTHDVYSGVVRALERQGHTLVKFNLSQRITQSGSWLRHCWKNARKSGIDVPRPNPADVLYHAHADVLLKALHHDCEWVLLFSAMYTPLHIIKILRKAGLKIALILTESPYNDSEQAALMKHVDIAWTHERASVDFLRVLNPNVYYLPHAYDEAIHSFRHPQEENIRAHDVVFVGTGFRERVELLSGVDWSDIDFGLYGIWQHIGSKSKLRRYLISGEVPNEVTAGLYRNAKIGLNLFRRSRSFDRYSERVERADSISLRTYELAACGCFFVSDPRPELAEVFGDLIPTFESAEELEALVRQYLADPGARERISRLLPEAVKGHTWGERAHQIMNDLLTYERGRALGGALTAAIS